MNKKNIKDEIFILNQPTHAIFSIVVINGEFPIPELSHERIEKLKEISDVFFVFSDKYFSESKHINKNKFSNLYGVCGWIDSDKNLYDTILKSMQYSVELFNHVAYSVINVSDVQRLNDNYFTNIMSLAGSTVIKPVFKMRRLSSREFFDIYSTEDQKSKKIFNKLFNNQDPSDMVNMFCSYTSTSYSMFFKKNIVNLFIKFWSSDEKSRSYISSFDKDDFRYFFASMTNYLGISFIDSSLEDLNIGKLSNEKV